MKPIPKKKPKPDEDEYRPNLPSMVHWTLGLASAAGAMGWEGYRRGNWPVMKQRCRHFSVMDRTCQQSEGEPVKSCPEASGPSGMFSLAHTSSAARVIILFFIIYIVYHLE